MHTHTHTLTHNNMCMHSLIQTYIIILTFLLGDAFLFVYTFSAWETKFRNKNGNFMSHEENNSI